MYLKSICLAAVFLISPQLYASNLLQLTDQPLTINDCKLETTGNALDLALANDGYFVVSQGKKNSELMFTRYGKFLLDEDYYIRTQTGEYLLGINKKSEADKLSKLKISMSSLPPKATSKVHIITNLPAARSDGETFTTNVTLYDLFSRDHLLTVDFTKVNLNTWSVGVSVDNIKLRGTGTLNFGSRGQLITQEGLAHIQWPADYGLNELKIDLSSSTAYATPYSMQAIKTNGYPLGSFYAVMISDDGDILLRYDNGQSKALQPRIAVAKFANPIYLERVAEYLYRSTEKSGSQRLHRINGEDAVLSGVLEQESCQFKRN